MESIPDVLLERLLVLAADGDPSGVAALSLRSTSRRFRRLLGAVVRKADLSACAGDIDVFAWARDRLGARIRSAAQLEVLLSGGHCRALETLGEEEMFRGADLGLAAGSGSNRTMSWAADKARRWGVPMRHACERAAAADDAPALAWLRELGFDPGTASSAAAAAASGSLAALRFIRTLEGFRWDASVSAASWTGSPTWGPRAAGAASREDTMTWLAAQGCPFDFERRTCSRV
jgi:hypothetical protein